MNVSKNGKAANVDDNPKKAKQNAMLYFLSSISAKIVGFFYFLLVAQWLDVADFGLISFAATIAVLSDTAADLGMGRYILREVARDPDVAGRMAGVFLPLKLLISMMIYGVAVLFLPSQFQGEQTVVVLSIYALWLVASGVAILLEQILHGRNRFGFASAARFVPGVVQLFAGAVVGLVGGGVVAFAAAAAVSSLSYIGVILLGLSHLKVRIDVKDLGNRLLPALSSALPYAAVTTLLLLSLKVEYMVFAQVADASAVGIYSMAGRLYEAALTAPFAFAAVMTAQMVRAAEQGRAAFGRLHQRTMRTAANGGVALALLGAAITQPFFLTVLPVEYAESATLLLIMLIGYPLMTLHLVNVSAMLALTAQMRPAGLMLGLTLLQLGIAKGLLNTWGMPGVASATVLFALLSFVASTVAVRLWLSDRTCLRALAPAAIAAATAVAVRLSVQTQPTYATIIAIVAAMSAMAVMSALLAVGKESPPN